MRLEFLGTGAGTYQGSRRAPCSALLDSVLLDCGAGTTGRLYDLHRFDAVDAVLISHLHADHVAGVFDLLMHNIISGRTRPLTVLSPPGLRTILDAVFAVQGTVKRPEESYPFHLIEGPSVEATVGRWKVRSVTMDHTILDLGYHLSTDGVTVFYSGDTRATPAARIERADYVVHEATYPDRQRAVAHEFGHSTSTEAVGIARTMGARRVWLTHVAGERPGDEDEIASEARRAFSDSVVAEDRSGFTL